MAEQANGGVVAGKATLQVGADVSGVKSGLQEGVKSVKQFEAAVTDASKSTTEGMKRVGAGATDAAQKQDASTKRFLTNLQRESDQVGKSRSEWLAYRAAQLGVAQQADPLIAKIRESEAALGKTGISAAQTAAALRMVPAQFTDIVTQLAGGQSALLVMTQQGGQLKDMFGGIVPAARALGGYIAGLVSPAALAAGAFGALSLAAYQGSQEQTAFQKSLTLTGNYVGVSANQLVGLSAEVARAVGTQGAAAAVLDKLAASGKVAADSLQVVGTAVVTLGKVGVTVKDSVGHFKDLGDEPVKAALKLNEQYHFLTDAVYQQIKALEERGDKEQAASLAQRTYAEAMTQRANQVLQNLGFIENGWNAVAGAAKGAWDYMLGLGRPDTLADVRRNIAAMQAELDKMGQPTGFGSTEGGAATGNGDRRRAGTLARLRALQQQEQALLADTAKAEADARKHREEADTIEARQRLEQQAKATRSRSQQRADEIEQLKKDAERVKMPAEEFARRVAAIEDRYKDRKPRGRAYTEEYSTRYLDQLRQERAAVQAQLADADKLTASERKRAEFEQQLADIKTKKVLTADQKSLLARQDEIRAQLDLNVAAEAALENKKAQNKEAEKQARLLEQARVQAAGVEVRLREGQQSRADQYSRQLDAFGLGGRAQEEVNAAKGIYRDFSRIRTDWIKSMSDRGQLDTPLFQSQLDSINDAERQALEQLSGYYDQLTQKRADWTNGATAAMADYRDYAANVADQTGRLFGGMFQGLEDSVVNFTMTGKASFGDFAKSVIADLVRIQARTALSGLLQMGVGAVSSMFAAGAGASFNGASPVAGSFGGATTTGVFYADGGYTGDGGKYEPAGVVHRGEWVVDKETTAKPGVRPFLEMLTGRRSMPGYADGGYVGGGMPAALAPSPGLARRGGGDIHVTTVVNMADGSSQTQVQGSDAQAARELAGMVSQMMTERFTKEQRQGGLFWRMQNGRI